MKRKLSILFIVVFIVATVVLLVRSAFAEQEGKKGVSEDTGVIEEGSEHPEKKTQEKEKVGMDKKENEREAKEQIEIDNKVVYLTFDDGPSNNTHKILDILKEENIKATFFPIAVESEEARKTYERIVAEGHVLGNHTYSHEYSVIYDSVKNYEKDFDKMQYFLHEITDVEPILYRFPGGSNNRIHEMYGEKGLPKKIADSLEKQGYIYVDWNVDSLDAAVIRQDRSVIENTVINSVLNNDDPSIILFHDASVKTSTVQALPRIISELKENGYRFDVLSENSFNVQFLNR